MKSIKLFLPLMMALWSFSALHAATDKQLAGIADMGKLNGIALQCRYMEQMQRIKLNLVLNLPKERALGDWFEISTNDSFMEFMNKGSSCPGEQLFVEQVDAAIKNIETIFKQ